MDSYGAPVRDNQPLIFLYVLGTIILVCGAGTLLVCTIIANQPSYSLYSSGPAMGAIIGIIVGGALISLGALALIAAATAHAINWQIVNRSTPSRQERPDLGQRLAERGDN